MRPLRPALPLGVLCAAFALSCAEPTGTPPLPSVTPVHSVLLTPDTLRLEPFNLGSFVVALRDSANQPLSTAGRFISWTLEDVTGPVTLFDVSKVYSASPATARVRATVGGKSATARVIFAYSEAPPVITVLPDSTRLSPGDATTLRISVLWPGPSTPIVGAADSWTSSDPTIASITNAGVVTAVQPGAVTVTATFDGVSATGTLIVLGLPSAWAEFSAISAGYGHSCGVALGTGAAVCWPSGGAVYPQPWLPQVDTMPGGHAFVQIAAAGHDMCGVRADSVAVCRRAPDAPAVVDEAHRWVELGVSEGHRCGVVADSTAWCWGSNVSGQLGVPGSATLPAPVQVAGGHKWLHIAPGGSFTCGIRADSTAMCWGYGLDGQLGDGTTTSRSTPAAVIGAPAAARIAAGWSHACLVTADGATWCWGTNSAGQLGDGTTIQRLTAVEVVGVPPMVDVAPRIGATCALSGTGAVWCWGTEFGAPRLPDSDFPATTFVALSGSGLHHCALADDGVTWCWGYGGSGELGDGTMLSRTKMVRVRVDY